MIKSNDPIALSYINADLLVSITYPANNAGNLGEEVAFTYLPQMLVDSVIGTDDYVTGTSYDAAGRVVEREVFAGAMQADYSYYPWDNTPVQE